MAKILVIGGTRFIGAHTVRQLYDSGAHVTVFHRGATASAVPPDVEHVTDSSASYPITAFPRALRCEWDVVDERTAMMEAAQAHR